MSTPLNPIDPFSETEQVADRGSALELLNAMGRARKKVDDGVRRHLASVGLSMTEFGILEALHGVGPMPLGGLAARVLVTGANTTYTVKKLERRGLMRRRPSADDQRVVLGELTPAGKKVVESVFPRYLELLRQAMRGLSTEERSQATRFLARLAGVEDGSGP